MGADKSKRAALLSGKTPAFSMSRISQNGIVYLGSACLAIEEEKKRKKEKEGEEEKKRGN